MTFCCLPQDPEPIKQDLFFIPCLTLEYATVIRSCLKRVCDNPPNQRFPPCRFSSSLSAEAKSCEDIQCSAGKKCLWDARMSRGRCSLCDETCPESRTEEAVCASDNTTYPSECAMSKLLALWGCCLRSSTLDLATVSK